MSGHEEKQSTVAILSDVVAGVSAAVSRNPADSGLRLTLVSCMRLFGRAEVELEEATNAVRGAEVSNPEVEALLADLRDVT